MMIAALGAEKSFGRFGGGEQTLAHIERYDVVIGAVRKQDRHVDMVNAVQRIEALPNQKSDRQKTPFGFSHHIRNRGEGAFQNQAFGLGMIEC